MPTVNNPVTGTPVIAPWVPGNPGNLPVIGPPNYGIPTGQPALTGPGGAPNFPQILPPVNLTGSAATVSSADPQFQALLTSITNPTALNAPENQLLQNENQMVDANTQQAAGNIESDFSQRGLGGPGQISDIEGNALAQNEATGALNKSNIGVGIQEQQDQTMQNALLQQYNTGSSAASQNAAEFNQLLGTQGGLNSQQNQDVAAYLSGIYSKVAFQPPAQAAQSPALPFANLIGSGISQIGGMF